MKKLTLLAVLVISISLVACDDFLSSSWGNSREYDYDKIDVNVNNWEEWNERAIGNPKLAAALQKKLGALLETASEEDKIKLRSAYVKAAIRQSGLGTLVVSKGADILSKDTDDFTTDDIKNLSKDLKPSFGPGSSGAAAADNIGNVLGSITSVNDNGAPGLSGYEPDAAEAGEAILILAMAISSDEKNGVDVEDDDFDFANFFETDDGTLKNFNKDPVTNQIVVAGDGNDEDPKAIALAALLNTVASDTTGKYDSNPITKEISAAFRGK